MSGNPQSICKNAHFQRVFTEDSLLFLTEKEYDVLTKYAEEISFEKEAVEEKKVQALLKKAKVDALNGLDIALFGRMVAKCSTMNIEAATSFSHAISTHASENEFDFFTAIDDISPKDPDSVGAAHMGSAEFNSATYYRYVSLNVNQLADTLGEESFSTDLRTAISEFIKALYLAVPAARQATMSASNVWDYAKIYVRKGQRMQCSFETPVRAPRGGGYLQPSIDAMKTELERKEKQSGSLFGKIAEFEFGGNLDKSIDELIDDIIAAIAK